MKYGSHTERSIILNFTIFLHLNFTIFSGNVGLNFYMEIFPIPYSNLDSMRNNLKMNFYLLFSSHLLLSLSCLYTLLIISSILNIPHFVFFSQVTKSSCNCYIRRQNFRMRCDFSCTVLCLVHGRRTMMYRIEITWIKSPYILTANAFRHLREK